MSTFGLLASVTASTKRAPTISSGKRGAAAENLASLKCTNLFPVDPEIRQRMILKTPNELLEAWVEGGLDILEGDILVVGSTEYPIRAVAEWYWPEDDANYLHLILEELKR